MSERVHARHLHIGTTIEREAYTPTITPAFWWDTDVVIMYQWNGAAWVYIVDADAHHAHTNKAQLDLVTDGDHDVRTDNPHVVTAEQAGASPTGHTHTHADTTGRTSSDHHARYADAEAVTAMGVKGNSNPLHHDRYTNAEALAAVPAASTTAQGKVELATTAETQTGTDATRAVTPAGLRADGPVNQAVDRLVRLNSAGDYVGTSTGKIFLAQNAWALGGAGTLDLDFTGTDCNTKAKCQAIGLRFSDTDVPFFSGTWHGYSITGTWAHSAGNGWIPTVAPGTFCAVILIPIARQSNWELSLEFSVPTQSSVQRYLELCPFSVGGHIGWRAETIMNRYSAYYSYARLVTNNGDDTETFQYTGGLDNTTGTKIVAIRQMNGVIGMWDHNAGTWNYFTGAFDAVGQAYPVSHLAVAALSHATRVLGTTYLRSLTLSYLT